MIKIGITGQTGFIGYHLKSTLGLHKEEFSIVEFDRAYFEDESQLDLFVSNCDVIAHLAAINRHIDPEVIYSINTGLVKKLVSSLERTGSKAHVLIASSTQEMKDNLYGKSKKEGRSVLSYWSVKSGGRLTGMLIPNVFGPFGQPHYNSVVATFCHQVARGENPIIEVDGQLRLIYVGDLVNEIINCIRKQDNTHEYIVEAPYEAKVSDLLALIQSYRSIYQDKGEFPHLKNSFELKLFNTYRCYMDLPNYFPRKYVEHTDDRGAFVEIARHGIPGQTSFSTTHPGITRGNHYHTRKIERFAVIKGKALIQLRRIGTTEVHNFELEGNEPSYVDMPIWYTHNIKNIGDDILYTNFWINEPFDPTDPDTFFETV